MCGGSVILTMAGRSQRFIDVGVTTPKWALRVGGRTMLHWAVESLAQMFEDEWELHLVALDEHARSDEFARALRELPVGSTVTTVASTPPGQAFSALAARHKIDASAPVAVWNADTHIRPGSEPIHRSHGDWLTLARLAGSHWSFADVDDAGRATRTAEKVPISPWASVGLYGFTDIQTLAEALQHNVAATTQSAEAYIAPLYNHVVAGGSEVRALCIDAARVLPFGTPDELLATCRLLDLAPPLELWRQ